MTPVKRAPRFDIREASGMILLVFAALLVANVVFTIFAARPRVARYRQLTDTSSRVTVQLDWAPEGLVEKVGALVGAGSHAVKKDLKNFKEFIEAQGVETGAWRGDVPA